MTSAWVDEVCSFPSNVVPDVDFAVEFHNVQHSSDVLLTTAIKVELSRWTLLDMVASWRQFWMIGCGDQHRSIFSSLFHDCLCIRALNVPFLNLEQIQFSRIGLNFSLMMTLHCRCTCNHSNTATKFLKRHVVFFTASRCIIK